MPEAGIGLEGRKPKLLTRELAEWANVVVTMGCGDECPYIPGKRYIAWDLPDPSGMVIGNVRGCVTRSRAASRRSSTSLGP